jgi:hypothetical protein
MSKFWINDDGLQLVISTSDYKIKEVKTQTKLLRIQQCVSVRQATGKARQNR